MTNDEKLEEKVEVIENTETENKEVISEEQVAETTKVEEQATNVIVEEKKESEEKKEEAKPEDAKVEEIVKMAEEKVQTNQEDGKNIELADNIVKENKSEENRNLPADIKPYLEIVKEKLKSFGKATLNVLEMIGDLVENLFKKKN